MPASASGTVASGDVSSIRVSCQVPPVDTFSIGGSISGLTAAGLVVTDVNGGSTEALAAGTTTYTLPTKLASGTSYAVSVDTQPPGLKCTVSSAGTGTLGSSQVTNANVNCEAASTYSLGGTISGLTAAGLVLSDAKGGTLANIQANATAFTLPNQLGTGTAYSVAITDMPPGLTCTIASGGSGTIGTSSITNVAVSCRASLVDTFHYISGTITGLSASGLVLSDSKAGSTISLPANTLSFTLPNRVQESVRFVVTVRVQPNGLTCSVSPGLGAMGTVDVTNIRVTCTAGPTRRWTVSTLASGLKGPSGVAVDLNGNIYVADTDNNLIKKIASDGTTNTFAGSGSRGHDDGLGSQATFDGPTALATDASGNIYVADTNNNWIRKVAPDGTVTTVYRGTGLTAPSGVAVDSNGNVFVADTNKNLIRKIDPQGEFTTYAGNGDSGYRDGSALTAQFHNPLGLAVGTMGELFVAEVSEFIRRIAPNGDVSTYASGFNSPADITVDSAGVVYVVDNTNTVSMSTRGGAFVVVAGSGQQGSANGRGAAASFSSPRALAVDVNGNIYVADRLNNSVRKITVTSQ